MKHLLSIILITCSLIACSLAPSIAWADSAHPSLIRVKRTHPPVHRHKAHKAGKHHRPRRPHHHAV